MHTSRLSKKSQVTVPLEVRRAAGLKPGDLVRYDVKDGVVTFRRVDPFDAAFHEALTQTLAEWGSDEDDEAFRDL